MRMDTQENAYEVMVARNLGKRTLGTPRQRWKNNI